MKLLSFTAKKLPEYLSSKGLLTSEQLIVIEEEVQRNGQTYDEALIKLKLLAKPEMLKYKAEMLGVESVDLDQVEVSQEFAQIIPASMARRYLLLCLEKKEKILKVAMANPADVFAIDDIRLRTGLQVKPVLALKEDLERALKIAYKGEGWEDIVQQVASDFSVVASEEDTIDEDAVIDAPVVRLVDNILNEAVAQGASDIHIEPFQKEVRVRYRVDGRLQEIMSPPKNIYNAVVSRIKIMADLDIAERRIPQDGRIKMEVEGRQLDLRVSTLPTMGGESVVMRLLDSKSLRLNLADLGFSKQLMNDFKSAVTKPNGIVLVTGPTGSGKSTTLYATIATLNSPDVKILTVEDPVEYYLRGVNQVQCKPKAGLTFAAALRSFLRQDPDIILVGEIRDNETAQIAIEAALTGHLVLSTLHTNDAIGAVMRLVDMEIEPFLIASSLNAALAQRLVRTICPQCKEPVEPTKELLEELKLIGLEDKDIHTMHGKGCKTCFNSGYKGRLGVYELMIVDDEVKKLISNRATNQEIFENIRGKGFKTLRENGLLKIAEGKTTLEEVLRVTVE
jgi:type IV pilus assembly protein PilB